MNSSLSRAFSSGVGSPSCCCTVLSTAGTQRDTCEQSKTVVGEGGRHRHRSSSLTIVFVILVLLPRSLLSLLLLLQTTLDETLLVGVEEEVGEPSCASRWCPLCIVLHGLLRALQHLKQNVIQKLLKNTKLSSKKCINWTVNYEIKPMQIFQVWQPALPHALTSSSVRYWPMYCSYSSGALIRICSSLKYWPSRGGTRTEGWQGGKKRRTHHFSLRHS